MQITGSCHCGRLKFEADIEETKVRLCHCTDCQRLTGTAYRIAVPAARDQFHWLSGKAKSYVKDNDDGSSTELTFCGDCGSPIYSAPSSGAPYGIRVGTIDQRRELTPSRQIWCRSELPWTANLESIPRFEKQP